MECREWDCYAKIKLAAAVLSELLVPRLREIGRNRDVVFEVADVR